MKENKKLWIEFIRHVLIVFFMSNLAIMIVGLFIGNAQKGSGGLYNLGNEGLSIYSRIQILIFSLAIGGCRVLLLSNLIIKKMMLLWRITLMLFCSFVTAIVCAVVFQWFPIESGAAWISFILSMSTCFIIIVATMIIKTKLVDRRYNKQLSAYKEKQKKEKGDKK